MTLKPQNMDGYDSGQVQQVLQTCLYLATKLGDLLDEIVLVGGLVPYLLIDQDNLPMGVAPHPGTMYLDLGFALAMLDQERYRELALRLRDAGFSPDVTKEGTQRLQSWRMAADPPVIVDFLIPPSNESDEPGRLRHIQADLAAIIIPGLDLAFLDREIRTISGKLPSQAYAARDIPVCGPGAFTVLKALAFGNRAAYKDAYDLFYIWNDVGVQTVAERLSSLRPNGHVDAALEMIERDFFRHDGLGPIGVATFLTNGPNDEIQADVVGQAQQLLTSLGHS